MKDEKNTKKQIEKEKSINDLPSYYENFTVDDLEIIKEKNPAQYTLIMARLKAKVLEKEETEKEKKNIMDFDDFI